MQPKSPVIALLCFLALAAPALAEPPKAEERDDKLVLENDHVTVWFQGKKPMLKVFPTANASDAAMDGNVSGAYSYKFTEVVEYRDLDGDGAPSDNEVVASLNLDRASAWVVNRSETEDGAVVLNLSLAGPVKVGPKADKVPLPRDVNVSLPDRDAEVRLVFTLREGATTLRAGDLNVTVPATSVKYDFEVVKWPFVDAQGHRLALVSHVEGALEVGDEDGVPSATVSANATTVGVLSWVPTANGTTAAGAAVEVPVKAVARAEGNHTRLSYTYDAAGLASLLHDPTVGVTPTEAGLQESGSEDAAGETGSRTVPGAAVGLGLALVGVAALASRRRA